MARRQANSTVSLAFSDIVSIRYPSQLGSHALQAQLLDPIFFQHQISMDLR